MSDCPVLDAVDAAIERKAWAAYVLQMQTLCSMPWDSDHADNWRQVVEVERGMWERAYQRAGE
jgi:hypothetical protein